MRMAECHPDRKYFCRGMCRQCYAKDYAYSLKSGSKMATCHPDKKLYCRGLCLKCYRYSLYNKDKCVETRKLWRLSDDGRRRILASKKKSRHTTKRHNISFETYSNMIRMGCAICGSPDFRGRPPHIDHDHGCCPKPANGDQIKSCGKCIRGMLCSNCNTMLGQAKDNINTLLNAVEYLKKYASSKPT